MKIFEWFFRKEETTYTQAQIDELMATIKEFNAGVIDEYLTKHVDKVYAQWLESHKGEQ